MAKDGFNIDLYHSITIHYILIYLFITVLLLSLINISSLLLISIKISKETFNNYLENTLLLNCFSLN